MFIERCNGDLHLKYFYFYINFIRGHRIYISYLNCIELFPEISMKILFFVSRFKTDLYMNTATCIVRDAKRTFKHEKKSNWVSNFEKY